MDTLTLASMNENEAVLFAILGTVGIIGILTGGITGMYKTRQRERTKREIAAYVAEGSITPQDAERIIKAGEGRCGWSKD